MTILYQSAVITTNNFWNSLNDEAVYAGVNQFTPITFYAQTRVRIVATDMVGGVTEPWNSTSVKHVDTVLTAGTYVLNSSIVGSPETGMTSPRIDLYVVGQEHIAPLPAKKPPLPLKAQRPAHNTGTGFYVPTGIPGVYDPSGQLFTMAGVNVNHPDSNNASVSQIALTGANVIRSFTWPVESLYVNSFSTATWESVILTQANAASLAGIAFMPVLPNVTAAQGLTGGELASQLTAAVDVWIARKSFFDTLPDQNYIINIANEWGPAGGTVWRDSYVTAISRLRTAGYTQLIVIDFPVFGQDHTTPLIHGQAVFDSDPQKNIVLSIHVYGGCPHSGTLGIKLQELQAAMPSVPFLIGEFGPGRAVGASPSWTSPIEVMALSYRLNLVGYIAWAWDDGAHAVGLERNLPTSERGFRLAYEHDNYTSSNLQLTVFGEQVIKNPHYGIKATSRLYRKAPSVRSALVNPENWSNPATWGGSVPTGSTAVVIPNGKTVVLDIPNALASTLSIAGRLVESAAGNIGITVGSISIEPTGIMEIGHESLKLSRNRKCIITYNGAEVNRVARMVLDVPYGTPQYSPGNLSVGVVYRITESGTGNWISAGAPNNNLGTVFTATAAGTPSATPWTDGLAGTPQNIQMGFMNTGITRGILVKPGGKLSLCAETPEYVRTRLNSNAAGGATSFVVSDLIDWKEGDEVVFGPSDFYGTLSGVSQKLILAADSVGYSFTTTTPLTSPRWGRLQYVTDSGMSLTPGVLTDVAIGSPIELDERTMVINLTRSIVMQGVDDTEWQTKKLGMVGKFLGRNSDIKLDGVEILRCGQAGVLERYPIEWHMPSYNVPNGATQPDTAPSDGTFLGNLLNNQYARRCAIHQSGQRMTTLHGVCGLRYEENVGYDITGHAIFLEDGSEMYNLILDNTVLKVRPPTPSNRVIMSDSDPYLYLSDQSLDVHFHQSGPTGLWCTNPQNSIIGNWFGDIHGNGIANTWAHRCFGLSTLVNVSPINMGIIDQIGNVSVGCLAVGMVLSQQVLNDLGEVNDGPKWSPPGVWFPQGFGVEPVGTYSHWGHPRRFHRFTSYKNRGGGYHNRANETGYDQFIFADNGGTDIFGSAGSANPNDNLSGTLFVAKSLNHGTDLPCQAIRSGFATYHEALSLRNTIMVGYVYQEGVMSNFLSTSVTGNRVKTGGGICRLDDLYLSGQGTFFDFSGFKLINCTTPYLSASPNNDGLPLGSRTFTINEAVRDTTGVFGLKDKTLTLNLPYYTYGLSDAVASPVGQTHQVVTAKRYYQIIPVRLDSQVNESNEGSDNSAILIVRQDAAGNEVARNEIADSGTGYRSLGGMHNFWVADGGRYRISQPGTVPVIARTFQVEHQTLASDIVLIGVEFTGSGNVEVGMYPSPDVAFDGWVPRSANLMPHGAILSSAANMAAVITDSTGTIFWRDVATQTVWFQLKGFNVSNNHSYYSMRRQEIASRVVSFYIKAI